MILSSETIYLQHSLNHATHVNCVSKPPITTTPPMAVPYPRKHATHTIHANTSLMQANHSPNPRKHVTQTNKPPTPPTLGLHTVKYNAHTDTHSM